MTHLLIEAGRIALTGAISYQLTRSYDKSSNPFMTAALVIIPHIIEQVVSRFFWTDEAIKKRNSLLPLAEFRVLGFYILPFFIYQQIGERCHFGTPSLINAFGISYLTSSATYAITTAIQTGAAAFHKDPKEKP